VKLAKCARNPRHFSKPSRNDSVSSTRTPSLRTKNRQQTKNDCLTAKAPYKFESAFLHQAVCLSGEPRGLYRSTDSKAGLARQPEAQADELIQEEASSLRRRE
jgi:hypothetical protein